MAGGREQRAQAVEVAGVLGRDDDGPTGPVQQLGRRSLEDEPAAVDHDQPVADLLELRQHVGGDDDRAIAAGEPADQPAHLVHAGRIEPVDRLVEDQQLRVAQQRARDPQALLHPERVAAEAVVAARREADQVQQPGNLAHVVPGHRRQHGEVLGAGQPG